MSMEAEINDVPFAEKCQMLLVVERATKGLAAKAAAIAGTKRDLNAREEALRSAISAEMQAEGVTLAEECGLIFSLQNAPRRVIVTDENQVPEDYFKVSRTLDKAKINAESKEGKSIPGTALSNGGQMLVIRTKGRN